MNHDALRTFLLELGETVSTEARRILREVPVAERTRVHGHSGSDVIYDIDHRVEALIVEHIRDRAAEFGGIVLIAEGIGEDEKTIWPEGLNEAEAAIRMIMDPIDGTRPLMYEKRSAFFLAGAAPNRGPGTRLAEVELAVMCEIPTTRAACADSLSAQRGAGTRAERVELNDGGRSPFTLQPSQEDSLHRGFVQFTRFFNPGKGLVGTIEDELMHRIFPEAQDGENLVFEDQYLSTGGQLYEMLTGKDRFVADFRGLLYQRFKREGLRTGHPCHPYDLAAHLIGEEAGLEITLPGGAPFDAPLDTTTPSDWVAYANPAIRAQVEAPFNALLEQHGLL